jgi:N4-gp56 family major capsid protein
MATIDSASLADQYQTYFSKKLLDHAQHELVLDQFALKADLPKKKGAKTIRWFRPGEADASQVQTLSEGVPISTFRSITMGYVEATMAQYGEAAKITDIVTMTELFDALQQSIDTMGEDCALHSDRLVATGLSHASTGLTKRYSGGAANFAALQALSNANGKVTGADILDAVTKLKTAKAKKLGAAFVCMFVAQVQRDLLRDGDILDPAKYQDRTPIAKGEIGMVWGARMVEHTNPFVEDETEGTYDDTFDAGGTNTTGLIYSTYIVGKGAYGTPKLEGTQSPNKPQVIINNKPDKSDPLNQFMTAGWKSYWAYKTLNSAWGICLRSKTTWTG